MVARDTKNILRQINVTAPLSSVVDICYVSSWPSWSVSAAINLFFQFLLGVPICQIASRAQLPAPGEVKMAGADPPSKVAMDLDGVQCFVCNVYCVLCCVIS